MAWGEILARTLHGFEVEREVSPVWLVNPATKRRLKLDYFYPELGLAVRMVGLTAKGQPKQSDWEALEEAQRDQTREALCREHDVELFLVEVDHAHPNEQLQKLRLLLMRIATAVEQSRRPRREKQELAAKIGTARDRLDDIVRRVKGPDDLASFAELWRDRELMNIPAAQPTAPAQAGGVSLKLAEGVRVQHSRFGPGVVTALVGDGAEARISILFDGSEERTFLASLASDKLQAM